MCGPHVSASNDSLKDKCREHIRGELNKALSDTRTSATLKIKTDGGLFSKMQAPDGSGEGGGVLVRPQTPLQPLQLYWLKPTDFPGEVGDGNIRNISKNLLEGT